MVELPADYHVEEGVQLQPTRSVSVLMMLTLSASACQDLPTGGDSPAPGGRAGSRSAPEGATRYTCYISTRDPDGPYPFVYKHVVVDFPKPALAETGETVLLRYAWTDPDGRPIAGANCRVPRTEMPWT